MFEILTSVHFQKADNEDEYDILRKKWKTMLNGGTSYDATDPDIAAKIYLITCEAQSNWDTMNKSVERAHLWSDIASTDISANVTSAYRRIKSMALANNLTGSSLKDNTALEMDIKGALDWMYTNRYNGSWYGDWWDWQVGAPLVLNDCTVLMYDSLSKTQISNYMSKIEGYEAKKYSIIGLCGAISKDSSKIQYARDAMCNLFSEGTSGNFFYSDGTYIQHMDHPYNLGYGAVDLINIADQLYLLSGSTWEVTDSNKKNVFNWVYKAFEPLIYKGLAMDMVRGREMARYYSEDRVGGVQAICGIVKLAQFAPRADAASFKSMIKYWINSNTVSNFYSNAAFLDSVVHTKAIMADSSVVSRGELIKYKQYPSMDRAVHLRSGFGFGISMHSSRISNYEADIKNENLKGWHTGDGMTYLYNSDQRQYNDNFWPTVNNYRLSGTTVLQSTAIESDKKSDRSWVGGASLQDLYGTTGMDYHAYGYNLQAKKSWFMFENEIVALGAGISSNDNKVVETVMENRKLNSSGNNALTVNGTDKSTSLGWSENMKGINWAHLTGNVDGSDIGYYFPGSADLIGLREARTENWNSINGNPAHNHSMNYTNHFLTMWFDHGTNPTEETYAYVLLPNMSTSQVSSYASNPQITILRNDTFVQAAQQRELNIIGANFWTDTVQTVDIIKCNKEASVMIKESSKEIEVCVSDPTQLNTGTIAIEISLNVEQIISKDSEVTVNTSSLETSTLKFTIDVNGSMGKTFKAKFQLKEC